MSFDSSLLPFLSYFQYHAAVSNGIGRWFRYDDKVTYARMHLENEGADTSGLGNYINPGGSEPISCSQTVTADFMRRITA